MTLHWRCRVPGCDAHGTTTGTESGADAKHAKTGHATLAAAGEWAGRAGE